MLRAHKSKKAYPEYKRHQCKKYERKLQSEIFGEYEKTKINKKEQSSLTCENSQPKYRCEACKKDFERSYWSSHERKNTSRPNRRKATALVCKTCRGKGYSAHDTNTYCCTACSRKCSVQRFDYASLRNFKNCNRSKLLCKACSNRIKLKKRSSKKQQYKCK